MMLLLSGFAELDFDSDTQFRRKEDWQKKLNRQEQQHI
jgi:hypothetical protein